MAESSRMPGYALARVCKVVTPPLALSASQRGLFAVVAFSYWQSHDARQLCALTQLRSLPGSSGKMQAYCRSPEVLTLVSHSCPLIGFVDPTGSIVIGLVPIRGLRDSIMSGSRGLIPGVPRITSHVFLPVFIPMSLSISSEFL